MLVELQTFLIAMTPLGELRASIPIALGLYDLSPQVALIISILGNLVPVVFLLLFLEKLVDYSSRHLDISKRFFSWLFERTRNNHQEKFRRWQEFALIILVAIPLPLTGAWTGSICAFVFGIPFKKAFPLIGAGVSIAGVIVTLTTLGIIQLI